MILDVCDRSRGSGGRAPATNGSYGFHIQKFLVDILADFFMEKGHTGTCSKCSLYRKCKKFLVSYSMSKSRSWLK